jgi:hypothetical protein
VSGLNSEGNLSELSLLPRRSGIQIPRELRLIFEWKEGKEEEYVVRFQDGTVFGSYPLKRLFLRHHIGLLEKLKEDGDSGWVLGNYLERLEHEGYVKREKVEIHKLAVHVWNVRHKPIDLNNINDAAFNRLVGLARDGLLIHPLIVVELDSETTKSFGQVAAVAKKYGYNPDEVLTGWLWRIVRPEGDKKVAKIVAKEEDEVYSAVSEFCRRKGKEPPDGTIDYLIIDGYQRYVAYCYLKLMELDSWKVVPKVPVYVVRSKSSVPFVMDPISTAFLSMKANESQSDLLTDERDREAFARFLNYFEGIDVALEKLGEKLKHEGITSTGRAFRGQLRKGPSQLSEKPPESPQAKYHIGFIEAGEVQPPVAEEEEREERRWEKREQSAVKEAMRPAVSEAQRQFAPTFSYAPAQPRLSAQTPISPQAQPIREEAQRSGQTQPVQLDEILVLSAVLMKFLPKQDLETALHSVFPGKGIDVKLDYNAKKALEESGLARKELEIDIRYTNVNREFTIPVGNRYLQLRTRVHVPVAWNKYCPNCGHLIVLSPTRCVFCGEVISPLPYVVSYKPAGT